MPSNYRGMTLIEVLVAFVVLSLTMAVTMQIFSGGIRNARLADSYSRAVFLAESKLAAVGIEQPLTLGESNGQVGATQSVANSAFGGDNLWNKDEDLPVTFRIGLTPTFL